MSLDSNTLVAISYDETVIIHNIVVGSQIKTFNYSKDNGLTSGGLLDVVMSSGTGNAPITETMVHITLANGKSLICSPEQKILIGDGKLRKSEDISTQWSIFLADGTTSQISEITIGSYQGGAHVISTSLTPTKLMNKGNLFSANGIIVADYALDFAGPDNY